MKRGKVVALVAAALVAGLTLGSIGIAQAAPARDTGTTSVVEACAGYGLKMGAAMRDAGGRMVDILADLTGLSTDDIHDRRVAGETVADIAESEGVETATVVDEALAVRKTILDAKVADGTIDAETRDEVLANMTDRINERVNSTEVGGMGRGRGGAGGGMGGGGGRGAGACGGCTTTTE